MNNFNESNPSSQGYNLADSAADNAKGRIGKVSSRLSDTVDSARQQGRAILDQVGTTASQVRDTAASASESLVTYTKDNPAKALIMAAAAGALFLTVLKALTPSRN